MTESEPRGRSLPRLWSSLHSPRGVPRRLSRALSWAACVVVPTRVHPLLAVLGRTRQEGRSCWKLRLWWRMCFHTGLDAGFELIALSLQPCDFCFANLNSILVLRTLGPVEVHGLEIVARVVMALARWRVVGGDLPTVVCTFLSMGDGRLVQCESCKPTLGEGCRVAGRSPELASYARLQKRTPGCILRQLKHCFLQLPGCLRPQLQQSGLQGPGTSCQKPH